MAKKILVIDDEELVVESLNKLLKKEGYSVALARNDKEAMEKIEGLDLDLIVADIRIPGINGVEIIKNIRQYFKEKGKKYIPEILITGYSSEDSLKHAQELKVADFIYKPFDIRDFLRIVKKNLK